MFFANGGGEDDCRHRGYYPSLTRENALKIKTKSKKVNKAWLNDHANDTYVKLAKKEGYRARAAYKLKEIDEQLKLIKPGDLVVDLGSAPGAWSQYVRRKLSPDERDSIRAEIVRSRLLSLNSPDNGSLTDKPNPPSETSNPGDE